MQPHAPYAPPVAPPFAALGPTATPSASAGLRTAAVLTLFVAGLPLLTRWLPLPQGPAVWMLRHLMSVALVVVPLAWASALTGTGRTLASLGGVVSVLFWVASDAFSWMYMSDRDTAELLIRSAALASDAGITLALVGVVVGTKAVAIRGAAAVGAFLAVVVPVISWATDATGTTWKVLASLALLGLIATAIAALVSAEVPASMTQGTWDDGAKGAKRFGQVLAGFFILGFVQNRLASTVGASAPELFDAVGGLVAAGLLLGGLFALRRLAKAPDGGTQVLASVASAAAGAGALIALVDVGNALVDSPPSYDDMLGMLRAASWGVALSLMLATAVRVAKARSQSGLAPIAIAGMVTYLIGLMALAHGGLFSPMSLEGDDMALVALVVGGLFSLVGFVLALVAVQRTAKACEAPTLGQPAQPHAGQHFAGQPAQPQPGQLNAR